MTNPKVPNAEGKKRLSKLQRWVLGIGLGALLTGTSAFTIRRFVPLRWVQLSFPRAASIYGLHKQWIHTPTAVKIVSGAYRQIGTRYDAEYRLIGYPNGDVPATTGACTDVVIRSLRAAGYDLQRLIHEDMQKRWQAYPKKWGLQTPNTNIDHRRVPNQIAFFKGHGRTLTTHVDASTLKQWQPGDIVYWSTGKDKWHTGILSNSVDANGVPLVIHNGYICVEDNCLTRWPIIGHFRFPK